MATLYRNTNKNNFVVIKQINMLDMTAQERQLALNEAKVLSLLSHPNIIRYCLHTNHTVVTRVILFFGRKNTIRFFNSKFDNKY